MAKATKQDQTIGKLAFSNIAKAEAEFNKKKPEKKIKEKRDTSNDFILVLRIDKNMYERLKFLHYTFITKTSNLNWDPSNMKDFFRFILIEFKKQLEANNEYFEATENFTKAFYKKGRRRSGHRSIPLEDSITMTIGRYQDEEIKNIHINICNSLANKEDYKHFFEYSNLYFFFDILQFMEDNIQRLIKENS